MKIQGKGNQQVSPKALERIMSVLAAIERENPQIDWDKYGAYISVRKQYRRWKIFPQRNVFIDVCLAPQIDREKETLEIPAGTFRPEAWKKRPVAVHGGPKWAFRMRDLKARKRHGKVMITMKEGE